MKLRRRLVAQEVGLERRPTAQRIAVEDVFPVGYTPAELFRAGEGGAWYDPNDLASMNQVLEGTIPAALNQPVGLLLDKRFGLRRGPEVITDTGFDDPAQWGFYSNNSAVAQTYIENGVLKIYTDSASTFTGAELRSAPGQPSLSTPANALYEFTMTVDAVTGQGCALAIGGNASQFITTPGTYRGVIRTGSGGSIQVKRAGSAGGAMTATVSYLSVKLIPGNHMFASGATRPTLRGESSFGPNLLTNGDFSNGQTGWTALNTGGATISVNANGQLNILWPDANSQIAGIEQQVPAMVGGKLYELEFNIHGMTSGACCAYIRLSPTAGTTANATPNIFDIVPSFMPRGLNGVRVYARFTAPYDAGFFKVYSNSGRNSETISYDGFTLREVTSVGPECLPRDLSNGARNGSLTQTLTATSISFANTSQAGEVVGYAPLIPLESGAMYEVSYTLTGLSANTGIRAVLYAPDKTFALNGFRTVNGTYTDVLGPMAGVGSLNDRINFQVNNAGGVGTISCISVRKVTVQPKNYYLEFDGGDDMMSTQNFDMGGSKLTLIAGIKKHVNNGFTGVVAELGNTAGGGTSTNTFVLAAPANSGTVPLRMTVEGNNVGPTIATDFNQAPLAGSVAVVYSGIVDKAALTVSSRINGGQYTANATNSGAGAGNFATNVPLYMGSRLGNLRMNGRIYGMILRGALTSAADLTKAEKYYGQKMGVVA